jgi:hypothetical protein
MHLQSLSSILSHVTLMNPDIRRKDLSTNNRATKAIGAMPVTGILLAAAALLSGFSSVIGSETAIAQQQQNLTGTNATTAANATGNQTATSSNQTGAAAATTSGGSSNAGTAGSYYP